MNRRYIPTLAFVVVLALGAVWLARHTYWKETEVPVFPSGEAAINPFYAAQRLARLLGAQAEWRQEFSLPPPGNGVIVMSGRRWNQFPSRDERLEHWVDAGGRLVVERSYLDKMAELERWTGVGRQQIESPPPPKSITCPRLLPTPKEPHCPALTVGDSSAGAYRSHYAVCGLITSSKLVTAHPLSWSLRDPDGHVQLGRVRIGRGSVTILNGSPFFNYALFLGDHALLLVAVTQLHRGDEIYFLSDEKGLSLLALMWNYGAPAIVLGLALVAAWLWRSGVRFGPLEAVPEAGRRSLAEQIRGTGRFTVRFGGGTALHAAAVRALGETAERYIPGYARLSAEERVATLVRLTRLNSEELSKALNHSGPRKAGDLHDTLALLESARRAIPKGLPDAN
jgi:hypothetical protein